MLLNFQNVTFSVITMIERVIISVSNKKRKIGTQKKNKRKKNRKKIEEKETIRKNGEDAVI